MSLRHRYDAGEPLLWSGLLACGVLVYAAWPELDLRISRLAFDSEHGFVANSSETIEWIHHTVPFVGWLMFLSGVAISLGVRGRQRLRLRMAGAALALIMLLGVAAAVNGLLKNHWGRARPVHVVEFGGSARYTPPLMITRQCERNCSFVSGHASTGFALMALGSCGHRRQRRRWVITGWGAGLLLGVLRIAQGGHFFGDVLFAGLLMWGLSIAVRPALREGLQFLRRVRHTASGSMSMLESASGRRKKRPDIVRS